MGDSRQHDAIIVGAGPAGSVAAYALARAGCRVLLLEREPLPRYKACGGALVPRAVSALPFPLPESLPVIERRVSCFHLTHNLERLLAIERESPALALTMRSVLDNYLVSKAVEAGATLRERVEVKSVAESSGSVRCETTAGAFQGQFLIGADGANSVVARTPPFAPPRCGVALEVEVYLRNDALLADYASRVDFDFNVLPSGYGWIFPKADHLSAGVFTLKTTLPQIKRFYEGYIARKGLAGHVAEAHLRGHLIPLGRATPRLNSSRILLAGDAAGLADQLTGEGISYAIRSGRLAAETIIECLHAPSAPLDSYSARLKTTLLPELRWASVLARCLYAWPALFYRAFARKPLFADRVVDAFEGKTTYGDLLRKALTKPHKLV